MVLAVGLWLLATAGATAMSWAATSLVRASVTGTHPYLTPAAVASMAGPDSVPAPTEPTTTTAPPAPATAAPPATSTPPAEPARATPAAAHPAAATPVPPAHRATFPTPAGTVTVACTGDAVALVGATPADGFRVLVADAGPDRVAVQFAGYRRRTGVAAVCRDGVPVPLPVFLDSHDGSRYLAPTTTTAPAGDHTWPTYATPDGTHR